jgi:hypothetical protein
VKPQRVRCRLGEIIEEPCSDVLEHTPEVCKGAHLYNECLASKHDHNSCGTCTTSVECKTIITVVITVMSGMDPHMISRNLGWVFWLSLGLGCVKVCLLGCWLVMVRLCDVVEVVTIEEKSLLSIY